jgi:plasmid stabilization system protein ParE
MKENKFNVIVKDKATEMMLAHVKFLARASAQAARKLTGAFHSALQSLTESPERFPWLFTPELPFYEYRKMRFDTRYLIIFTVIENTVYVEAVVDCREDYGRYLGWEIQG